MGEKEAKAQVLLANARSEAGKLYRLLKDAARDGSLKVLPMGWDGFARVRAPDAVDWAEANGIVVPSHLKKIADTHRESFKEMPSPQTGTNSNAASRNAIPLPTPKTALKRAVLLTKLSEKYPSLGGALSTNDPAFADKSIVSIREA